MRRPRRRRARRIIGLALASGAVVILLRSCAQSPAGHDAPQAAGRPIPIDAGRTHSACDQRGVETFLDGLDTHLQYGSATPVDDATAWWAALSGTADSSPPKVRAAVKVAVSALDPYIDARTAASRKKALPRVVRAAKTLANACGLSGDYDFDKPKKKRSRDLPTVKPRHSDSDDDFSWNRRSKHRWG